jgi:hypothetical protein
VLPSEAYGVTVPPWLSVDPNSGEAEEGEENTHIVTAGTAGLATGVHHANITVTSNDPSCPVTTVPVVLTVTSDPPLHSSETPPDGGTSSNLTPQISVEVTDVSGINHETLRLYVDGFQVFFSLALIPNGFRVYYWHEMGFAPNSNVACRIVASDFVGNELDYTWHFSTPGGYDIPVVLGWNLVSVPLSGAGGPLPGALADLCGDTEWDRAMWYDPADALDRWKQYNPEWAPSLNDMPPLDSSMGVWIRVIELGDGNLTLYGDAPGRTCINLRAGWNLVGYPTFNSTLTVAEAFWGTSASVVEVFDPSQPYCTRTVGPNYVMTPGKGYWVYANADSVWIVDW